MSDEPPRNFNLNSARTANVTEVRNDYLISYIPNADFKLWIKPVLLQLVLGCLAMPFLIYGLSMTPLLTPIMDLGVLYLLLTQYFLGITAGHNPGASVTLTIVCSAFLLIFLWCAIWLTKTIMRASREPNVISLTPNGMVFGKVIEAGKYYSYVRPVTTIDWAQITNLNVIRPLNTRSNRDYSLVFDVGDKELKLRIGDIVNSNERVTFLERIKGRFGRFLDDETVEVFIPRRDRQSYTELWLAELAAPPKRDRLTPLEVGARVHNQKYEVLSRLGVGGQGTVYLASQIDGGADVVLKEFVLPVFPDTGVRKAAAVRFQDEANLLTKLNHPQIVKMQELFLEDHRAYLVLEHLDGQNLKDLVGAQGPLPTTEIYRLAGQMCDILIYLHGRSPPVVHRDFTPDNLILDQDGLVKLIDFSVAQSFTSNVTGSVVGKPHYIAPEQFRGKPTVQSDIYSMGATLFYLATGQEPEPITNLQLKEFKKNYKDADKILAQIIEKATKLDVAARYQNAGEILKTLPDKK